MTGLTNAQVNRVARTRKLDARITFVSPSSGTVTEIASAEGIYVAEEARFTGSPASAPSG
ncbi:efflux RND transporter periplasmic adaptor subunit [Rufibacter sp. LB8]|uniref:efflux RND transporter periplasmic adaptor subunit n=1 Tax=Rufibacter sp. LB8 TaxID=2777781 RepID=UPI00178C6C31